MPSASPTHNHYHVHAALLAMTIVAVLVMSVPKALSALGSRGLDKLLLVHSSQKDMGTLLQRLAFENPNILPVYGSSELTRPEPNRADQFFANAPTGFKVCPVGAAGNTTLMMAQKLAAQGSTLNDRKLVMMLSCSWFRRDAIPADNYKGGFSIAQAMKIMLDGQLDPDIRRRLAERMLDYPETLKDQPALAACVRQAAKPAGGLAAWLIASQRSLLYFQHTSLAIEDDLGTLMSIGGTGEVEPPLKIATSNPLSWDLILADAEKYAHPPYGKPANPKDYVRNSPPGSRDRSFIDGFGHDSYKEWSDFELLLDTLKYLHAKPMIIAIPLDGPFEEAAGTTKEALYYYYNRLEKLCAARGFPLQHFPDHDKDQVFVIDHGAHLTGKGWLYVNHLLDDFYHDRLPAKVKSTNNP